MARNIISRYVFEAEFVIDGRIYRQIYRRDAACEPSKLATG
jgi:hypothetical protein